MILIDTEVISDCVPIPISSVFSILHMMKVISAFPDYAKDGSKQWSTTNELASLGK